MSASADVFGMTAIDHDLGENRKRGIMGDAGAAIGMIQRKCMGNVRQAHTHILWIQEKHTTRNIDFKYIKGNLGGGDLDETR